MEKWLFNHSLCPLVIEYEQHMAISRVRNSDIVLAYYASMTQIKCLRYGGLFLSRA